MIIINVEIITNRQITGEFKKEEAKLEKRRMKSDDAMIIVLGKTFGIGKGFGKLKYIAQSRG